MSAKQSKGFTLIEIVVGLVVISIVTLVITVGMGSLFRQTVDPWQQVRAAELGQSLMNEIMSRKFDENNISTLLCNSDDPEKPDCTNPPEPTATNSYCYESNYDFPDANQKANGDREERSEFDDVDDFNCLGITTAGLTNIFGNDIEPDFYRGFSAEVRVFSVANKKNEIKQIDVVIITPQGGRIQFSAQRGNW